MQHTQAQPILMVSPPRSLGRKNTGGKWEEEEEETEEEWGEEETDTPTQQAAHRREFFPLDPRAKKG